MIELVAKRREYIAEKKTEVGSMASNFLEVPHERVNVLEKLVKMVPSSAGSNKDNQGTKTCHFRCPQMMIIFVTLGKTLLKVDVLTK